MKGGDDLGTVVLVFVFLAIAGTCWMIVQDTDKEVDDAEQEEYLKKWMEERKK